MSDLVAMIIILYYRVAKMVSFLVAGPRSISFYISIFSRLLSESDQEKKLFISVWTHSFVARNEMIGCMTFLISDLVGPNKVSSLIMVVTHRCASVVDDHLPYHYMVVNTINRSILSRSW